LNRARPQPLRKSRRGRQVNFNTLPFRKEHGHQPRGVAIWVFYFADDPESPWVPRRPHDRQILPMTFLAAKDYATAEAVRRRVSAVKVDPHPL
jgi:hypothetical protein